MRAVVGPAVVRRLSTPKPPPRTPILPPDLIKHLRAGAPLENVWIPVVFGVAFLISAAVLFWRYYRRRRAGTRPNRLALRRTAAACWLVLLAALAIAAEVNRYVGYVPSLTALSGQLGGDPGLGVVHPDANKSGSRLLRVEVPAVAAGMPALGAYVYLPPGYDDPKNAAVRYPVLYLIHGSPGWPIDWFRAARAGTAMDGLLDRKLVRPMILVGPTANRGFLDDSECLNAVNGPQIETYLTKDVVGFIDAHYRTVATRDGRGIGGISAGGYCALNLGLRHQDEYSVVLAHMPYGDPGPEPEITRRLLGGDTALYRENSPRLYLPALRFTAPVAFFMDVGSRDSALVGDARRLAAMIVAHHQQVELRVVPGEAHTWRLGRDEVPYSLAFASTHFDQTLGPAR